MYWWSIPQENNTTRRINNNIHSHCFASTDRRFGYAQIFLVCSIQGHPYVRLLVDWALNWGAEWFGCGRTQDPTPHNSTQGQAEQRPAVHRLLGPAKMGHSQFFFKRLSNFSSDENTVRNVISRQKLMHPNIHTFFWLAHLVCSWTLYSTCCINDFSALVWC